MQITTYFKSKSSRENNMMAVGLRALKQTQKHNAQALHSTHTES